MALFFPNHFPSVFEVCSISQSSRVIFQNSNVMMTVMCYLLPSDVVLQQTSDSLMTLSWLPVGLPVTYEVQIRTNTTGQEFQQVSLGVGEGGIFVCL